MWRPSKTAKSAFSASKTLIWRFWKGDLNQGLWVSSQGLGSWKVWRPSKTSKTIWRFGRGDLNQGPLGFESGTGQVEGLAAFQTGQIGFFLEVLEGDIIRGPFLISNPSGWVSNNFWRGTPSKNSFRVART